MKNVSKIALAFFGLAVMAVCFSKWKKQPGETFLGPQPGSVIEILPNSKAPDRKMIASCESGNCNWRVRVIAVTPAGSGWHFDITRYVRHEFVCESLFSSRTHQTGIWYEFPVVHDSSLQFFGEVYPAPPSGTNGGIIIEVVRPTGLMTTHLLTSSTIYPNGGYTIHGVCPESIAKAL